MRPCHVNTSNTQRFLTGVGAVLDRGAEEACLMVVDGLPGLGKSETTQWWAVQQNAVFVRAKQGWTPNWMLRELLAELSVTPERSFERMYRQALEALAGRAREAGRTGETFGVVVDEIDHICRRAELLETLRDLSDFLEIPFVLVGMDRVRHLLTRYRQIASRVAAYVEFKPASIDDARALAVGLCEVGPDDELLEFLHRVSEGHIRELKEGLARIERFGRRNGGPVSLDAMDGQVLLNDRHTGRPVSVTRG